MATKTEKKVQLKINKMPKSVFQSLSAQGQISEDELYLLPDDSNEWGSITGSLSAQADLKAALDAKADKSAIEPITPSTDAPLSALAGAKGTADFVNSSINAFAAFYITKNAAGDPFATAAELQAATTFYNAGTARVPTKNDYAIVVADEQHQVQGSSPTTRWTFQGTTYPDGQWEYQYTVNNAPLTTAQLAALNSGIDTAKVAQIATNKSSIATLSSDKADKTQLNAYALSSNVDTRLSFKADKTQLSAFALSSDLSTIVTVKDAAGNIHNDLSVMHMTIEEYAELIQLSALQPNCIYVLDVDNHIDAFGQQIKNLAEPTDLSDATPKWYVDQHQVDPSVLSSKADLSAVNLKADISSVGNGTLTIKRGTTTLGTFTANQKTATTVTIPDSGNAQWGSITGQLTAQADLNNALSAKATVEYVDDTYKSLLNWQPAYLQGTDETTGRTVVLNLLTSDSGTDHPLGYEPVEMEVETESGEVFSFYALTKGIEEFE